MTNISTFTLGFTQSSFTDEGIKKVEGTRDLSEPENSRELCLLPEKNFEKAYVYKIKHLYYDKDL